ncbi:MAG: hypothetical protein CMJ39_00390 [Phycisphaerae bacterium]|nr:hypothetical protein [Phycisphaerae bacterium]|tara:strand:- start:1088 stop:1369 length:282 start_codon:yes stop_codon:yes gene_type:complete
MKKANTIMDLAFKVVVAANLIVVNYTFFTAYAKLKNTLNLFQSEMALQMEQRLTEEFQYFTKDLEAMKGNLLDSQKQLIPAPAKVKSGPPILF